MRLLIILLCIQSCFCVAFGQAKAGITGKEIFENKCARCHGADGTKGKWGAKDLQKSRLEEAELGRVVAKGRNFMPAWEKRLSADALKSVVQYVKGLRK